MSFLRVTYLENRGRAGVPSARQKRIQGYRVAIGHTIRQKRVRLGFSQAEVGRRAGCGPSHISQIENGTGNYSLWRFLEVCAAIELDPGVALGDESSQRDDELFNKFQELVSGLTREQVEFLLSLDPMEMKLLCERAQEVIAYRRTSDPSVKKRPG